MDGDEPPSLVNVTETENEAQNELTVQMGNTRLSRVPLTIVTGKG